MVRVELPAHLRTLAGVAREVSLDVPAPVTQRALIDTLEAAYPMLAGTMRDHVTGKRRPFVRFFACGRDWSLLPPDTVIESLSRVAASFCIAKATTEFGISTTTPTCSSLNQCAAMADATATLCL